MSVSGLRRVCASAIYASGIFAGNKVIGGDGVQNCMVGDQLRGWRITSAADILGAVALVVQKILMGGSA